MYRICSHFRLINRQLRCHFLDDIPQHLNRELLTLIVSQFKQQKLVLMAKETVIAHFACQKSVAPLLHGCRNQEVPCPAADGHFLHRFALPRIIAQRIDIEQFLHPGLEILTLHRLRQIAIGTFTCVITLLRA